MDTGMNSDDSTPQSAGSAGGRRPSRDRGSLAGPIPMAWMTRADAAGGSALALGIALWFQRGVSRRSTRIIRVNAAVRKTMNLTPDQTRRAVAALACHGLIRVHSGGRGRCAQVEILDDRGSEPVGFRGPSGGGGRRSPRDVSPGITPGAETG